MSNNDPSPNIDPPTTSVNRGMKSIFNDEEHRVWESIFPPAKGMTSSTPPDYPPRRRRPSALYMSKIVRSLAELGVYPVFRTKASGELVPWDSSPTPDASWKTDNGIRSRLGNLVDGSDPNEAIDAWYHPSDLAKHFGADAAQWVTWPDGMTGVRIGPSSEDVVLRGHLSDVNTAYLTSRNILQRRGVSKVRLVSTGGAAFFAAAATEFWKTPDDRARIGRLKTKLEVDFKVRRNSTPIPADPVIADLDRIADSVRVGVPRNTQSASGKVDAMVPQIPLFVQSVALSPEEELRRIEARAAELRREIETRDLERRVEDGRRRHYADIEAFRTAVGSAKVSVVDLRVPDFDPRTPDRIVSDDIRIDGIVLALPDGREFAFGTGVIIGDKIVDLCGDETAFEANPVQYTFG